MITIFDSVEQAFDMCACRQKKSFFIEDILNDVKKKPYKNLSNEPKKPLVCTKAAKVEVKEPKVNYDKAPVEKAPIEKVPIELAKFNVVSEAQNDIELNRINLEHRRNTYPLHPMPIKASLPWHYRGKDASFLEPRQFSYYSEPMLNTDQILRNQLVANRFVSHPFTIRHAYGFDRVPPNCCNPWWGLGGRRKGGQVRFSAGQTGALERRFNASKYLSPDERRGLASTLRLSDRQVKTWFQNRRAKWRRTTPESADAGSPPTADEGSDDDVHIADDE